MYSNNNNTFYLQVVNSPVKTKVQIKPTCS